MHDAFRPTFSVRLNHAEPSPVQSSRAPHGRYRSRDVNGPSAAASPPRPSEDSDGRANMLAG